MQASFLEIVELPNGDIVLQRADGEGEPLVNIRFSGESKSYMSDAALDVARAMIQTAIEAVAQINSDAANYEVDDQYQEKALGSDASVEVATLSDLDLDLDLDSFESEGGDEGYVPRVNESSDDDDDLGPRTLH